MGDDLCLLMLYSKADSIWILNKRIAGSLSPRGCSGIEFSDVLADLAPPGEVSRRDQA
jgi:hypothetical protein